MNQIFLHQGITVKVDRYCAGHRTDRPDILEWFSEQHIVYEPADSEINESM